MQIYLDVAHIHSSGVQPVYGVLSWAHKIKYMEDIPRSYLQTGVAAPLETGFEPSPLVTSLCESGLVYMLMWCKPPGR